MLYADFVREKMNNSIKVQEVQGIPPLSLPKSKGKPLKDYKIYGNTYQRLPQEYQEVEYIESSGTQWINTEILSSKDNRYVGKFNVVEEGTGTSGLFGARYTATNSANILAIYKGSGAGNRCYYPYYGSVAREPHEPYTFNTDFLVDFNKNKCYIDNNLIEEFPVASTEFANQRKIYLLNANNNNSLFYAGSGKIRCYYFKIYNNDILVRNFIPCYNKTTNVIGLYDLVEDKFYTNQGTGTFTKGSDVIPTPDAPIEIESFGDKLLPEEYQEVEYIESDGQQFIDTKEYRNGDTIEVKANAKGLLVNCLISYGTSRNFSISFNELKAVTVLNNAIIKSEEVIGNYKKVNIAITGNGTYGRIFNYYPNTSGGATGKVARITHTRFNAIYEDFVPCYRKSDGEVGLYDTVNEIFYTNQGAGTFAKGNDVNHYKIPIEVTNGTNTFTTNIILNEPLRRIGDYADYIDFKNQKVVRKIKNVDLDTLQFGHRLSNNRHIFDTTISDIFKQTANDNILALSESYQATFTNKSWVHGDMAFTQAATTHKGVSFVNNNYTTVADFVEGMKNKHFIYVLATPIEESITLPPILTAKGDNTLDVNTKILPSNVIVKYIK